LLLLREERLVPLLARLAEARLEPLPERLEPRALARSLCAWLFWLLAFAPLLAAWARLVRPDEGDALEDDEEEELRDAMACSLVG
jgi:hypothetical protein